MFHIVALLLFSSIMFAAVYQFWFNKNDITYRGLYCRATVLRSEWSCENGGFRRHNSWCTVFLWQQCISSRIPVTRISEDGGFRRRNSWCTLLLSLQCISSPFAVTCIAVMGKSSCAFVLQCMSLYIVVMSVQHCAFVSTVYLFMN